MSIKPPIPVAALQGAVQGNLHVKFLLSFQVNKCSEIMGNPISKVRDEVRKGAKEQKEQMEERLQILQKMMDLKLSKAKHDMLIGEKDDQEIHSGTVVAKHQQINITVSNEPDESISNALSSFFQGDFVGGLAKIVEIGANTVLGNATAGEYETTDMFIVWSNNALLRCDAYYYRWNFAYEGVIEDVEGVVGVFLMKRVIDVTKTDPQVLTYAISQMAERLLKPLPSKFIQIVKMVTAHFF